MSDPSICANAREVERTVGPERQVISIATTLLRIANAFVARYAVGSGARFAIVLQSPEKFAGTMKYFPWPAFVSDAHSRETPDLTLALCVANILFGPSIKLLPSVNIVLRKP